MLTLTLQDLIFSYENSDESLTYKEYWDKESEAFDKSNATHMMYMLEEVCKILHIDEIYGAKRMEATIQTDAPTFAWNRRLLKQWLVNNFQY